MSDGITITVDLGNGRKGTLADVSKETLLGMRDRSKVTIKPIEHGDYGFAHNDPRETRVFIQVEGELKACDKRGILCGTEKENCFHNKRCYTVTGNVFK